MKRFPSIYKTKDFYLEDSMAITQHNPKELFPQYGNYCHAVEVSGDSRILFISGLNGYKQDGTTMPDSFEDQA